MGKDGTTAQERRIYVGNLPYSVRWQDLKDYMKDAGDVVFADIMTLRSGKSKGCGIVEFPTVREAQDAISMFNHQSWRGRELFIREDREAAPNTRGQGPPGRGGHNGGDRGGFRGSGREGHKLFVSNIPFSSSWQDLKDLFKTIGPVIRADVLQTADGRSKGVGTVSFESSQDADDAIAAYNGWDWNGRTIEVREDKFAAKNDRGGVDTYKGAAYNRNSGGGSTPPPPPPGREDDYPYESVNSEFTENASGDGYPSETVYAENLPWSTTNQDLLELFGTVGNVEQAEIKFLPNGKSAGVGVIKFDTPASAEIALAKFAGYNYGNRNLKLSYVSYPDDQAMQYD